MTKKYDIVYNSYTDVKTHLKSNQIVTDVKIHLKSNFRKKCPF